MRPLPAPERLVHISIEQIELLAELPDPAAERVKQRAIAQLGHARAEVTQARWPGARNGGGLVAPLRRMTREETARRLDRAQRPRGPLRAAGSSNHRRGSGPRASPRRADGREGTAAIPASPRGRPRARPRFPGTGRTRPACEAARIQWQLAVRIAEQPAHLASQFQRPAGVRAAEEAPAVVVVGVKVVPDDRLAAKHVAQLLDVGHA